MLEGRNGPRATFATAVGLALSLGFSRGADGADTADAAAERLERRALKAAVAGDQASAIRSLKQALRSCELSDACSAKTRARLHVSLGTVLGVGEGDYQAAKQEFTVGLALDPKVQLRTHASRQLSTAFEDARVAAVAESATPAERPAPEKPVEKAPQPPLVVTDLFKHDEAAPPPSPVKEALSPAPEPKSNARFNWVSLRAMVDFAFLSDANVCSPGASSRYLCTAENGARYTGLPQPNDDVSSGLAPSTARLVLGYERLLVAGLTAGAFAGLALPFKGAPTGRSVMSPLHLEARVSYAFGSAPYADAGDRFNPFVFVAMGAAQIDSHVVIRVNEIPCGSKVSPACKRDLDVYRRVGDAFTTLGAGVRVRLEGRHGLRAAVRGTLVLGGGGFVLSPELAYELGF